MLWLHLVLVTLCGLEQENISVTLILILFSEVEPCR